MSFGCIVVFLQEAVERKEWRDITDRFDTTTVLAVPSSVVWKSTLPLRKKLVLVAICSMTVFMMICAIVRIAVGMKGQMTDLSWFLVWNSVEMTLGMFSTSSQYFVLFQRPDSAPVCIICEFPAKLTASSNHRCLCSLFSQSVHPRKKHTCTTIHQSRF